MQVLQSEALSPPVELRVEHDPMGRLLRTVAYQKEETGAGFLAVITLVKQPRIATSERGGFAATSLTDASRAAVIAACNINGRVGPADNRLRAVLRDPHDERWWNPAEFTVGGVTTQGRLHRLSDGFWSAAAELLDAFVAVAGSPALIPVPALTWHDHPTEHVAQQQGH